MKKVLAVLFLVSCFCAGCIQVEQNLVLNKDGSGTMEIIYGMAAESVEQMNAMKQALVESGSEGSEGLTESSPFDFDEEQIRNDFEKMEPQGLTLESVDCEDRNGWKYMHIKLSFKDIKALVESDAMTDNPVSLTKDADGNYVLLQKSAGYGMNEDMGDSEMTPEMLAQMGPMLKGMRFKMSVETPTEILETNADAKNEKTASWDFNIGENPELLNKIQEEDMRIVFSGKGVDLPEISSVKK